MFDFFKKKKPEQPKQSDFSVGIPKEGDAMPESLKAHSRFIKRVSCPQCGAPKSRPSTTAYIYCDFCGSLMDYDFRMANANTNAGITNTIYARIMMTVQMPLMQAKPAMITMRCGRSTSRCSRSGCRNVRMPLRRAPSKIWTFANSSLTIALSAR